MPWIALVLLPIVVIPATVSRSHASRACDLPTAVSLETEERTVLDGQGGHVVVLGSPAPTTGLRAGDVLRQANGRRVANCADLEAAAAEARAKGLVLLLAVERQEMIVAAAVATARDAPVVVAAPAARNEAEVETRPLEQPAPREVVPTVVATPMPFREAELPPRSAASAEIGAKAVAAAAVLATVDEAARLVVPLPVYERRLDEATNAIAALRVEGEGSAPVRALIAETIGYHETARDIRRYKAAELKNARIDQRGPGATSVAYFSDSDVPGWIERYPFLSETLQQAPRTTHMLLPGEMAGRWNPDQAAELLWERARVAGARLGAWGAAK